MTRISGTKMLSFNDASGGRVIATGSGNTHYLQVVPASKGRIASLLLLAFRTLLLPAFALVLSFRAALLFARRRNRTSRRGLELGPRRRRRRVLRLGAIRLLANRLPRAPDARLCSGPLSSGFVLRMFTHRG